MRGTIKERVLRRVQVNARRKRVDKDPESVSGGGRMNAYKSESNPEEELCYR